MCEIVKKLTKKNFQKTIDKLKAMCYNVDNESEVITMKIKENTNDKNYPITIEDGWGGKVCLTEEGLKEIEKFIKNRKKALTK